MTLGIMALGISITNTRNLAYATLNIMQLVIMLSVTAVGVVMLGVAYFYCYAECC